jgi:hypothetical protein
MVWYVNSSKTKAYHTMRTVPKPKHNIPWEQLKKQNIPYH